MDLNQFYDLSPRQWSNIVDGKHKNVIDQKRINAEAGYVFARANNGGKLNSYLRALDVQESKIGKTDEELKKDTVFKKAVFEKQKADMSLWYKSLHAPKTKEKEDADE